ncbi:hypothetical protein [Acanthopleuribacter pedis]|uniref:CRISPR-associated protein Csx10 n=1 Tax=Acanthopleuribacter pedis TaxID=442870 RepID=A0A8J7Q7A8_9BACT|nr:hypothetical protein [Acanthopleuribacter pedis]MBO1321967.1 hypothetical protein [Acanthopleuribacter pedis]
MRQQSFNIVLESEIAVGSPGSVHGGRDSLDYLGGSLLLGAAAARLYTRLGETAWTVFHTGKVRFGDGLPLSPSGLPTVPVPPCLIAPKQGVTDKEPADKGATTEAPAEKGARKKDRPGKDPEADFWRNAAYEPRRPGWNDLKGFYLSPAGERVRPCAHYRLKTAVDPRSGVAMAHQLYGYHGLAAGQTFRTVLEADDDVPPALFDQVVQALTGTLRLGRSRSTEYGRCRVVPVATPPFETAALQGDGVLNVLLLSDLVVENSMGVPCPLPPGEALGLPAACLVPARCFVRHGRHRAYNGKYRAFEGDLTLIRRGSVLAYQLENPAEFSPAQPIRCVGLFRQRGFGRMWLNPPFLNSAVPQFSELPTVTEVEAPPQPDLPLAHWLTAREATRHEEDQVQKEAEAWHEELVRLLEAARVRGGLATHTAVGPSPAQWGRITEAVAHELAGVMDIARLHQTLFDDQTGICKTGDPDWDTKVLHDTLEKRLGQPPTFRTWLRAKLEGDAAVQADQKRVLSEQRRVAVLARFARVAADRAKEQRMLKEGTR